MIYTELLPSLYPVAMRPHRATFHPYLPPCMHPYRPTETCKQYRRHPFINDDFIQHVFETSDSDEEERTKEIPAIENLFRSFLEVRTKKGKPSGTPPKSMNKEHSESRRYKESKAVSAFESDTSNTESTQTNEQTTEDVIIAKLDMRDYDPKGISVKASEKHRTVTINAKHPVFTPLGAIMHESSQVVPIPNGIAARDIRSFLSASGIFYLQVPKDTFTGNAENKDSELECKPMSESFSGGHGTEDAYMQETHTESDKDSVAKTNEQKTDDEGIENKNNNVDAKRDHIFVTPTEHPEKDISVIQTESSMSSEIEKGAEQERSNSVIAHDHHENPAVAKEITELNDTLLAKFTMCGFKPEEVNVTTNKSAGIIEVSAQHEENTENRILKREYYRAFPISQEITDGRLETRMSPDGVISIRATKKLE